MRRLLLLGATSVLLALSPGIVLTAAQALVPYAEETSSMQTAVVAAAPVDRSSKPAGEISAAKRTKVEGAIVASTEKVILLSAASLVFAAAAVGTRTLW